MLDDQPAVLDELETGDEEAAEESVEEYVLAHHRRVWVGW
jgi:hypothetical protein